MISQTFRDTIKENAKSSGRITTSRFRPNNMTLCSPLVASSFMNSEAIKVITIAIPIEGNKLTMAELLTIVLTVVVTVEII